MDRRPAESLAEAGGRARAAAATDRRTDARRSLVRPFRGDRLAAVRRIGTAHETSIEAFGPDRCTFESNFPPDKGHCSYQTIFNAFKGIAAQYSEEEKTALFSRTAMDFYRLKLP